MWKKVYQSISKVGHWQKKVPRHKLRLVTWPTIESRSTPTSLSWLIAIHVISGLIKKSLWSDITFHLFILEFVVGSARSRSTSSRWGKFTPLVGSLHGNCILLAENRAKWNLITRRIARRGKERERENYVCVVRVQCIETMWFMGWDMSKLFSWTVTSIDSNLILTMERISLRGKWNGDWSNIEILYRNWFRWNNSMSNIDDHAVYLRFIRSWRNMQKIFAS